MTDVRLGGFVLGITAKAACVAGHQAAPLGMAESVGEDRAHTRDTWVLSEPGLAPSRPGTRSTLSALSSSSFSVSKRRGDVDPHNLGIVAASVVGADPAVDDGGQPVLEPRSPPVIFERLQGPAKRPALCLSQLQDNQAWASVLVAKGAAAAGSDGCRYASMTACQRPGRAACRMTAKMAAAIVGRHSPVLLRCFRDGRRKRQSTIRFFGLGQGSTTAGRRRSTSYCHCGSRLSPT